MLSSRRLQAFAVAPILLGLTNFAILGYALATYEPQPADGGTSIFGLFVGIVAVLAGLVLLEGVVAAGFVRFLDPSVWACRLTAVGLLGTTLAGGSLTIWNGGAMLELDGTPANIGVVLFGVVVGGIVLIAAILTEILVRLQRTDGDGIATT